MFQQVLIVVFFDVCGVTIFIGCQNATYILMVHLFEIQICGYVDAKAKNNVFQCIPLYAASR